MSDRIAERLYEMFQLGMLGARSYEKKHGVAR